MKKLSVILLSVLFAFVFAQDMKNIENYRIYKMSEYLELTPQQAETFFPLLRQYEKELKNIKSQENELYKQLKNSDNMSKEDLQKAMNKIQNFENSRNSLKQNFMKQSGKTLNPNQVARIPGFENEFRNNLKQQFIQRQKQQNKTNTGKKGFKGRK
jgi:hypothetical protein